MSGQTSEPSTLTTPAAHTISMALRRSLPRRLRGRREAAAASSAAEHAGRAAPAPSSAPSMPLLDLPDDLLAIILASLPDAPALSAAARR